jgi:integrase/recombinase XerD
MANPLAANPTRSFDVSVYARHNPDCRNKSDRKLKECTCPKWLYIKATQERRSARTIYWKVAEREGQRIRDSFDPDKRELAELKQKKERNTVLIEDAIERWLANKKADNAKPETLESYGSSLRHMRDHFTSRRALHLHEIAAPELANWKTTWPDKAVSSKKKRRVHAKSFFRFCVTMHWLEIDPSSGLTKIIGKDEVPTIPFERDQYKAIIDATYLYDQSIRAANSGEQSAGTRLRTFIQVMRWSGLAIQDTATLQRSWLGSDDLLKVRRTKTGTWVTVPLPPNVANDLRNVPPGNAPHPDYFFWSGQSKGATTVNKWNRSLRRLWKLVDWRGNPPVDGDGKPVRPHSHMFRNTFAAEILKSGQGDIRDVAKLLGHSSIKTTEKHYLAFVPSQAERLNERVRASWAAQGAPGHEAAQPKPPVTAARRFSAKAARK